VLMRHLISANRVVTRPLLEIQALAKGECSFVESGSDGHDSSGLKANEEALADCAEWIANYSFDFPVAASAGAK
jgi:hypothetical protein